MSDTSDTTTTTTTPAAPDYSQNGTPLPDNATLADIVVAVNALKASAEADVPLTAAQTAALGHVVAFFG